jgi:pimeloyl-ACP methyl ester carboxylesterase
MPSLRRGASNAPVLAIALHCSGANGGQWRKLADGLAPGLPLIAPDHYGCDGVAPWPGLRAFTLADEAARTIAVIDRTEGPVVLVGHSYGGGVALHVALARPDRIAALALYEPSAFHILPQIGPFGVAGLEEISALIRSTKDSVASGDYRGAAERFVEYWNGPGAWAATKPALQDALTRWAPKASLDFSALSNEPTEIATYRGLRVPSLIMHGQHAPRPTRAISEALASLIPAARLRIVAGAGHMGPLTHASDVNFAILDFIDRVAPRTRPARIAA